MKIMNRTSVHRRAEDGYCLAVRRLLCCFFIFSLAVFSNAATAQVTITDTELLTDDGGSYDGETALTFSNAGGGGVTMTFNKTGGSSTGAGGDSSELFDAPFTTPVRGIWLGSDDAVDFGVLGQGKAIGQGLDSESYVMAYPGAQMTSVVLEFGAVNRNIDGDERIVIDGVFDENGVDVTASTTFSYTSRLAQTEFDQASRQLRGTVGGNASGNAGGTLTISNAAGFRTINLSRIEIPNSNTTLTEPGRNRTNGITLGPITYTELVAEPQLDVVLSISSYVDADNSNSVTVGDVLNYAIDVTNIGNTPLTNLIVDDVLRTNRPNRPPLIIDSPFIGSLAPGVTQSTATGTYTLDLFDQADGFVEFNVDVRGTTVGGGASVFDLSDTGTLPTIGFGDVPGTPQDVETVTSDPAFGGSRGATPPNGVTDDDPTLFIWSSGVPITLEKGVSRVTDSNMNGVIDPGDIIDYKFKVINRSSFDLRDIQIEDQKVTVSGGPITIARSSEDSTTYTASYTILDIDALAGGVENSATARARAYFPGTNDPVPNIFAPGDPLLGSDISDADTFPITVSFFGVTSPDSPDTIRPVGPGPGEILTNNLAGNGIQPADDDPTVVVVVPTPAPGLTVAKTIVSESFSTPLAAGDTIAYQFVVTNSGNVNIDAVTPVDPGPTFDGTAGTGAALVFATTDATDLAPTETATFTATYTLTAADAAAVAAAADPATSIANSATATGTPVSGTLPPVPPSTTQTGPTPGPGLTVAKSISSTSFSTPLAAGDTIAYQFVVTNSGNVNIDAVTPVDPGPTFDGTAGTGAALVFATTDATDLAPTETATFTATYTLTAADAAAVAAAADPATSIANSATATGTPVSGTLPPVPPSTTQTGPTPGPGLTVAKSISSTSFSTPLAAGDTIAYQFVVTNSGNVNIDAVTPVDPGPTFDGTAGTGAALVFATTDATDLAPTETATFTATYTLTAADAAAVAAAADPATSIANSATATGTPVSGTLPPVPPSTTQTGPTPGPGLTVAKSISSTSFSTPLAAGDTIAYQFVVTNSGNVNIDAVTPVDPGPTFDGTAGTGAALVFATTDATDLAPTETATFTATYTLTAADAAAVAAAADPATSIANSATATGTPVSGTLPPVPPSTTQTGPTPGPGLTVAKSISSTSFSTPLAAGDTIAYQFVVTNSGNVNIDAVTPVDPGPTFDGTAGTGAALVFATTDATDLAPTETATFTATYTLTAADAAAVAAAADPATSIANSATATGTPVSGTLPPVPPSTTQTGPASAPAIALIKTSDTSGFADPAAGAVGDTIIYNFLVTNTGNTILADVAIPTDVLSRGVSPNLTVIPGAVPTIVQTDPAASNTLAPLETLAFTATYTLTQDDIDAGGLSNTATATGQPPNFPDGSPRPIVEDVSDDDVPGSDSDPTVTSFLMMPELDVAKSVTALSTLQGDGTFDVDYTVTVVNSGNVTLDPLTLVDDLTAADQLGSAFSSVVTAPVVSAGTISAGSTLPTANAGYDGTDGLIASSGVLIPGDSFVVSFTVNVDPNAAGAPATLQNIATATGLPPGGTSGVDEVSDQSDTDTAPDGTPDGTPNVPGGPGDPTVVDVPLAPVAVDDVVTGLPTNTPAVVDPLVANGGAADSDPDGTLDATSVVFTGTGAPTGSTVTDAGKTLTVPGEGVWTIDLVSGEVTFTPQTGFTDDPTPATYTVDDNDGNTSNEATITLDFDQAAPVAVDDSETGVPGDPTIVPVLGNDTDPDNDIDPTTVTFTDPTATDSDGDGDADTLVVPGEGTWDIDPLTGDVTFTPEPAYVGDPTPVTYTVTDETGLISNPATITIDYPLTGTGISGIAYIDQDASGTYDPAIDDLLPGVIVELRDPDGNLIAETITDADGFYELTNFAVGFDYIVSFIDPDTDEVLATIEDLDFPGGTVLTDQNAAIVPSIPVTSLEITKNALIRDVVIGGTAPFEIVVSNNTDVVVGPVTIVDRLPVGLVYTPDSATLDGAPIVPTVDGRMLTFTGVEVPASGTVTLVLQTRVTTDAPNGDIVNRATVIDPDTGIAITPEAEATIRRRPEAIFNCSDVIGKVFDDRNMDGYQNPPIERPTISTRGPIVDFDAPLSGKFGGEAIESVIDGEPGLPNVRVVTPTGTIIITDQYGRFNVPCAELPGRIGSNFALKVDTRSLPTGYRMTTENPLVMRLTSGNFAEMNFGAAIGRVVGIDLTASAYRAGTAEPLDQLTRGVAALLEQVKDTPSIIRLSYFANGEANGTADARLDAVEQLIRDRWARMGRYRLVIERTTKQMQ